MVAPNYQLKMRAGATPGEIYPLEQEEVVVGRDLANDIAISDPEVSRRHARFVMKEGVVFVEDLGSTNGTFLNGTRLSSPQPLRPGDTITFGDKIVMVFEEAGLEMEPLVEASEDTPARQPLYEQAMPAPVSYDASLEPDAYQPPTPQARSARSKQVPAYPEEERRGGFPTWLIVLLVAIVVIICVIAVTLYFMPASWWCAITFDMLQGCPVP
jgi:pSer/pThr/pTyr-binding forkhead associated (FHA) protein